MLSLLSYDFIQRAFLAVIAMSLFSPVLGTFLILRRQSLMSDTLSHVSLSGVAFGLVLGIFSNCFYYCHCLDCGGLSGVSPYSLQELYGNRDSYPHVNRSGCFSDCHEQG